MSSPRITATIAKVLIMPCALVAMVVLAIFMGYGIAYPGLLSITSLLLALGTLALTTLVWTCPQGPALTMLCLVAAVLMSVGAGTLANTHMTRCGHAQITVNFVKDLSDQYDLVKERTHVIAPGETEVEFFKESHYDAGSGLDLPTPFLVTQIPLFEHDRAILKKDGVYYVNPAGPDFDGDPLFRYYFLTTYPKFFLHP